MRFYAEKFGEGARLGAYWACCTISTGRSTLRSKSTRQPVRPSWAERGLDEELIQDILSHGVGDDLPPRDTTRRKALMACDEITGLITTVALVRPSRSLLDLKVKSVKKKWKDKAFAAGANRDEIEESAAEFGVRALGACG